jgi:hypothetical protein
MQAPVETVKTRLKRALERLRERLVARGGNPRRLYSGLLLVANGLVGTVGATGGVVAGVLAMTVKQKVGAVLIAAAVIVAAVEVGRSRGDVLQEAPSIAAGDRVASTSAGTSSRADGGAALDASRTADGVMASGTEAPANVADDSPPTEITGRVVDLDGRPVEGAEICNDLDPRDWPLRRLHAGAWPSARTGTDGRFVFRRPSKSANPDAHSNWAHAAPYSGWADALVVPIDVAAAGYVPARVSPNGVVGATTEVGDVQLAREARITGSVGTFEGDDPTTVVVTLDPVRPDEVPRVATFRSLPDTWRRVHCDEDGRFEIGGVGSGRFRLWAGAPGRRNTPTSAFDLGTGQTTDVELALEAPCDDDSILHVRVLAPDGSAVEGARLDVAYREPSQQSVVRFVSDEKGEVRVPTYGLSIDQVVASVRNDEWLPVTRKMQGCTADDCELQFSEPRRIVLLVHSADETPLEEVKVEAEARTSDAPKDAGKGRKIGSWTSDAGGRVEMNLPEGVFRWRVRSEGFVETFVGPMRVSEVHAPIEVALVPAPAFTGRVTFEGRPVAGALVSATCMTPGRVSTVHGAPSRAFGSGVTAAHATGPDGRFRIQWRSEEGIVFLHAHAIGFATAEIGPFDVGVADSASGLEIALTLGGSIEGRVMPGSDGSRARYVVASNGDGNPRSWPISVDGTFRIDHLAPGPWNVRTHDTPLGFDSLSVSSNCGALDVLPSNCVVRDGETTTLTISSDDTIDCIVRGEVTGLRDATTPYWARWWQAWIGPSSRTDEKIAWDTGGDLPNVSFDRSGMLFRGGEPPTALFDADAFEFRREWCDPSVLVLALRLDGADRSCVVSLRRPWTLKQGIARWTGKFELGVIEGTVATRAPASLHVEADATTADGFCYHARVRVRDDGGFTIPRAPAGEVHVCVEGLAVEQTVQVEAGATTNVALR